MKRRLSICFLCAVTLGLFMFWGEIVDPVEESRQLENEKAVENNYIEPEQSRNVPSSVETNKELKYFKFIIYQDGERLTVYESDNTTVFMETDILVEQLQEDVRKQLGLGLGIRTEEEIYDVLGSDSS